MALDNPAGRARRWKRRSNPPNEWDPAVDVRPRAPPPRTHSPPDFEGLERDLECFFALGVNSAGYPVARPRDCLALTTAFQAAFRGHESWFALGHEPTISRFFALLDRYGTSPLRGYGNEVARLDFLRVRVLTVVGRLDEAAELASRWGERPYRLEGDFRMIVRALQLDLNERLRAGRIEEVRRLAIARAIYAAGGSRLRSAFGLTRIFHAALSVGPPSERGHWVHPILTVIGRLCVWHRAVGERPVVGERARWLIMKAGLLLADATLLVAARLPHSPMPIQAGSERGDPAAPVLVTRPLGGLGDLLMMTPGLRALARRQGRPVAFAIPAGFHSAFRDDADFELLDSDAFIDISRYRQWHNLGLCPAARYESTHTPGIRRGRVELFAEGMGVSPRDLESQGQAPVIHLSSLQQSKRQDVRRLAKDPGRPLVGVALYSREGYRDYAAMNELLAALAERHTVLAMHPTTAPLPASPHILGWFERPLRETVAAISACDVIVSVDTAIYHIAGALDVPAVAIFGPTSAAIRSMHIPRKVIVEARGFACQPCWRNEDQPCKMSGGFVSACMASIEVARVLTAVDLALGMPSGPAPALIA